MRNIPFIWRNIPLGVELFPVWYGEISRTIHSRYMWRNFPFYISPMNRSLFRLLLSHIYMEKFPVQSLCVALSPLLQGPHLRICGEISRWRAPMSWRRATSCWAADIYGETSRCTPCRGSPVVEFPANRCISYVEKFPAIRWSIHLVTPSLGAPKVITIRRSNRLR